VSCLCRRITCDLSLIDPCHIGKTAPRFLQDIALYDPDHPPASGRNLLSEVPPVFSEAYNAPLEWISPAACKHTYVTKVDQTFLLSPEQTRGPGTASKVSAICSQCRYHLQLVVNYTTVVGTNFPGHIHHLVYKSGRQRGGSYTEEVTPKGQRVETFHYECSYATCSAVVSLRMLSPVLGAEWVRLLTDQELLKQRADEAIAGNPERLEGIARPLPINVLDNLRTYIHNALHDPQRSKPISAINKRFIVCFGVEGKACKDLLEFLEFQPKVSIVYPHSWLQLEYLGTDTVEVPLSHSSLSSIRPMVSGNLPDQILLPLRRIKMKLASFSTMFCMSCRCSLTSALQLRRRYPTPFPQLHLLLTTCSALWKL
jgi:ubiquitin carboxyl-terminal hydrolase 25/28